MRNNKGIRDRGVSEIGPLTGRKSVRRGELMLPDSGRASVVWGRDEAGLEHVSVSPFDETSVPTWADMCRVKDTFFLAEEAYQIHPRESSRVNMRTNCLHLWRPIGSTDAMMEAMAYLAFMDMVIEGSDENGRKKDDGQMDEASHENDPQEPEQDSCGE